MLDFSVGISFNNSGSCISILFLISISLLFKPASLNNCCLCKLLEAAALTLISISLLLLNPGNPNSIFSPFIFLTPAPITGDRTDPPTADAAACLALLFKKLSSST